ncbi:sulfotransferase family protein [Croceicoccus hydrothermalis]|uniref:sulfotransferase family protein n=1 Tax=Croceicoccus hydrothermalis TaxID=2867964 RepID=UPI001EFAC2D9
MTQFPSFLIVGAAKSGTTVFHQWLSQQAAIFTPPVKEPHFFCFEGRNAATIGTHVDPHYAAAMTFEQTDYERLFADAQDHQLTGEASPGYLYFPGVARAIRKRNPDAKIVFLLRNPVERAYSQFMHHVRDGYEPLRDFTDALCVEGDRIARGYWWGYHYRAGGMYARRIREYLDVFPRENLKFILFDDLVRRPESVLRETLEFLGVPYDCRLDLTALRNCASGMERVPRYCWHARIASEHRGIARIMKRVGLSPQSERCTVPAPPFDPGLRRMLLHSFRPDMEMTAELIDRDLSHWLYDRRDAMRPNHRALQAA